MGDESAVFEFEKDFAQSLRCIPMSVRLKLDCCGLKVSLRQWNRLDTEDRRLLLQQPCDSEPSCRDYHTTVVAMIAARTGAPPGELPVEPQPAWRQAGRVPEQLLTHMAGLQLTPLSAAQWAQLGPVRRFALLKLSRPGHSNDNFLPALLEFGLLGAER